MSSSWSLSGRGPRRLAWMALLGAAGCQAGDPPMRAQHSAPLVGATTTDGDPAVVALTTPGGSIFCTGTLVSPSVVVTAAHCIDDAGAAAFAAYFGSDTEAGGARVAVSEKYRHPGWTGALAGGHDIGVLRLAFAQDPTLPVLLNQAPLEAHVGEPVRIIGFGIHDAEAGTIDGKKRTGAQAITELTGDFFEAADDTVGLCSGDSGGPALLTVDGVEQLAGVNSYAFGECEVSEPSGYTNVSRFAAEFVLPWIQENDPACGEDGLCARIGCADDPDCTPCGPDGTCTDDCPLPDRDCPSSDLGEICQADSQCESGLCVFWTGDPSSHFCTRPCDREADDCPAGLSCQTVAPFGDVCYYDDPPPGVLGDACTEPTDCGSYLCRDDQCVRTCDLGAGALCPDGFTCTAGGDDSYYCIQDADEGGGCNSAGAGGAGGLAIVLAGLGVAVARKRRISPHRESAR